jgi:SAM-dependent methyltransferase
MSPGLQPVALRACPVCGGSPRKRLFRQSFAQLSGVALMDGYDVVVCQECGAGFADGIPPQATFDTYYRELSKYEDREIAAGPPPVEQRFRDIAGLIDSFIPSKEARVLEIGCASGGLLKALSDRGFTNLLGSDPSPGCVRAAREFYGIAGVAATVFTVPQPETPYDFLILTGVLEHVPDLENAIAQFRRLLRPEGRVYLEVPDASRYEPRIDAPFQEFSIEHINFFSRTSLANLMQSRGFRTVATGLTVRPLHEVSCPCTYGVFENAGQLAEIAYDADTEAGLRRYVAGCRDEDERIRSVIADALSPEEQMIVWGTGTHTLRLLATGGLLPERIAAFVDSNPKYQNQRLRGVPVVSPQDVRTRTEPILISSRSAQGDIHRQIRDGLGLDNRVILLYGSCV